MLPDGLGESGRIALDFGLVRGLAYYNGIIFEVSHPGWPAPLGGGGRYDGLARDLGGDGHLPALGFAYNLDALADLAPEELDNEETATEGILVVASTPDAQSAAVRVAQQLREQGRTAELEVCGRGVSDALFYAARHGLRQVITVENDGGTASYDV